MQRLLYYPLRLAVYLVERVRLWLAKREAIMLHHTTGKRYWVIKLQGKYRVYSSLEVKTLKQIGVFRKDLDWMKLNEVAVFKTK